MRVSNCSAHTIQTCAARSILSSIAIEIQTSHNQQKAN
ncbi:hypothetical protein F4W67_06495 [Pseudomonas caricapapayae]|nr:hypothetical protein F4W67_06495 [Pseudomonas caricapapayae]